MHVDYSDVTVTHAIEITKYANEYIWEFYRRLDFSPLMKHADVH